MTKHPPPFRHTFINPTNNYPPPHPVNSDQIIISLKAKITAVCLAQGLKEGKERKASKHIAFAYYHGNWDRKKEENHIKMLALLISLNLNLNSEHSNKTWRLF